MPAHRLRLRRTKVKEMEVRPLRMLVMQTRYRKITYFFFMILEEQKLLSGDYWSRWLHGHTQDKEGLWKLKNQSDRNTFKLGPEHRSRHPNHSGANGSSIRARTRENEPIKFLVKVGLWARFKCPTI